MLLRGDQQVANNHIVQARMERLEIEPASSDASSTILAAWPDQMRAHQVAPASSSSIRMQPSTGKAALAVEEALVPGSSQQPNRISKDNFLEALIQPSVQTHIQVQLHANWPGALLSCVYVQLAGA